MQLISLDYNEVTNVASISLAKKLLPNDFNKQVHLLSKGVSLFTITNIVNSNDNLVLDLSLKNPAIFSKQVQDISFLNGVHPYEMMPKITHESIGDLLKLLSTIMLLTHIPLHIQEAMKLQYEEVMLMTQYEIADRQDEENYYGVEEN